MTEVPEFLDVYRIEAHLGRGGMGEVFLAWDERLERHVAIKRIRQESASEDQRKRLRREARATARLNHSAIVQIYDVFESEQGDCLVMEYVDGKTIRRLLAGGALDVNLTVQLARQIADGLAEAHARGIVHRDLKPENVMVTQSGQVKICDFGLARALWKGEGSEEVLTGTGAMVGTVGYMAPEQVLSTGFDHRTDLFSLGVLLYEMLTGRAPFQGSSQLDTLNRIVGASYTPISEVEPALPAPLIELVSRLLSLNPEARPQSARLVERALSTLEQGRYEQHQVAAKVKVDADSPTISAAPIALDRPRAVPRPGGGVGSWWRLVTAAAVGLVVLAGTGWLLLREPAPPRRVVVLMPEIRPNGDGELESLEMLASTTLFGCLRGLGGLAGVAAIDPNDIGDPRATRAEIARAVAADDVVVSTVEGWHGDRYSITLQRVDGRTGETLWLESFEAPFPEPRACRQVADTVGLYLRQAFPEHELRAGVPQLEVRNEDYAAFVRVFREIQSDGQATLERLAAIERLLEGSLGFTAAHLEAANLASILYTVDSRREHIECALTHIQQARALSPNDSSMYFLRFRAEILGGQLEKASATLAVLERLVPGEEELIWARADLARAQGKLGEALRTLRAAIRRFPTWRSLYRLADLEVQAGEIDAARSTYGRLLELVPGSYKGRLRLADLELLFGDLAHAEQLYGELVMVQPSESLYTNLGLAQLLRGDAGGAVRSFQEALRINPASRDARLNLADALLAAGDIDAAQVSYRRVRDTLEQVRQAGPLRADEQIVLAQCLVHLDEPREAVALAQAALRSEPEQGEIQLLAALVLSAAGERLSALACTEKALDLGVQPRWFTAPFFESMQRDPEFLRLVSGTQEHPLGRDP